MHHGTFGERATRARVASALVVFTMAIAPAAAFAIAGGNGKDNGRKTGQTQIPPGHSPDKQTGQPGNGQAANPTAPGHGTVLSGNSTSTDLPTWANVYDWPQADGYVGWTHQTSAGATGYSSAPGLPGRPGLWEWPSGRMRYSSGRAGWHYTAPGTTRILSAVADLRYDPRLLSQHCVHVALRDASGAIRDRKSFCRPPLPPRGTGKLTIGLGDPAANPTSTDLAVELELPCRAGAATSQPKPGTGRKVRRRTRRRPHRAARPRGRAAKQTCQKYIPVANGTANRLRVTRVQMVLVDDDLPVPAPAGEWYDLRDRYVNGQNQHALHVAASDAGAGVASVAAEEVGAGVIASSYAPCDSHHNTPELGTRICPATYAIDTTVDATQLAEGRHQFRETATDLAGNAGASDTWSVFVDRTPPSLASNFDALLDPGTGAARVTWDGAADPDLIDGSPGSGLAGYRVRYSREGGPWTDWQDQADTGIDVPDSHGGERIDIEVRSVDAVGNLSEAATATVFVEANLTSDAGGPAVYADDELAIRDGDYVGTGELNLLVGATGTEDDGVSQLSVEGQDGHRIAAFDVDCTLGCPGQAEHTFTIDTRPLGEGPNMLYAGAIGGTGLRTLEPATEVFVDHTAPAEPSDPIVTEYDDATRTATIDWTGSTDPPLADGVPGAGRGRTTFRYHRAGGWSDWYSLDEDEATVPDLDPGEAFTVEIQAHDKVGNASSTLNARLFADDTQPDPGVASSASAGRRVGVAGRHQQRQRSQRAHDRKRAHAATDFTNCTPLLDDVYEQQTHPIYGAFVPVRTLVQVRLQVYCHTLDSRFDKIQIKAGIAIKTGDGTDPSDFTKVTTLDESPDIEFSRPHKIPALKYVNGPSYLCAPQWGGERKFVAYGQIKYIDSTGFDVTRDFDTGRGGTFFGIKKPGPMPATCPNAQTRRKRELAGWRKLLLFGPEDDPLLTGRPSTPRAELKRSLGPQPYAKSGTKNAWQAHHTVPSAQRGADDMRELLFRCRIHPNEAQNGVYLRGSGLLKSKDAYLDLVDYDERHGTTWHKRAYHGDTFGGDYVSRLRSKYLSGDLRDFPENCSLSGEDRVRGHLSDAAQALRKSSFGVEDDHH
jgi:hypothetical protein